jgi:hypothetical protein
MLGKARTSVIMAENLESALLDKPRPGTKRPFHDRSAITQAGGHQDPTLKNEDGLISSYITDSRIPTTNFEDGDVRRYPEEDGDYDSHVEKRSRTSDWPLRSTVTGNEAATRPRVALHDRYDTLNSASPPRYVSAKSRPSKFVEGSMNDRASQKPHPSYIGDSEQPREQFEAEQNLYGDTQKKTQLNGFTHHMNRSVALSVANDKSEVSRPSGIFRFGKSVAAAFNPSSWKIWSKQQEEDNQEKRILKERHEKAEKIYKELKRTGQLRRSTYDTHLDSQVKSTSFKKHDSGVDLEHRASRDETAHRIGSRNVVTRTEEKRYGRIFLDPPSIGSCARSDSPASEISAPLRNSSFHYREPALQADETSTGPQALRRLPSRKDLQKQQKLVKRVSDLEGKLEAARRQLAEALGEPVPAQVSRINRSRFTPGILSSLPSERLLSVYTTPESDLGDADTSVRVGRAVSIDKRLSSYIPNGSANKSENEDLINSVSGWPSTLAVENALVESNITEESHDVPKMDLQMVEDTQVKQAVGDAHQHISDDLMPTRQTTRKRKSIGHEIADDGGRYKLTLESEDDDSSEAPKIPMPKRRPGRPRKLQKVDTESKPSRAEPNEVKHSIPGAVKETNNPHSHHVRKTKSPKDGRVVLSKKAASSENNSRIPRKGRYSTSPPPSMSSFGTGYAGQEVSTGKTVEKDEGLDTISIVPYADVPPIPKVSRVRLANGQRETVPNGDKAAGSRQEADTHGSIDWDQKKSETINADIKKGRAKSKQAFEWPEDVF